MNDQEPLPWELASRSQKWMENKAIENGEPPPSPAPVVPPAEIPSVNSDGEQQTNLKRTRREKIAASSVDRLPPHSPESEQGVIGCIMLSPNECMGECIEKLKKGAEVFYDLRHQTIYSMMLEMFDRKEPIDVITLQQRLKDKQLLEQVGGLAYLSSLPDTVPSAANISYYTEFVLEKYLLRTMINVCTSVVGKVYDYTGDVETLMDEMERDIFCVRNNSKVTETLTMRENVNNAIAKIEEFQNRNGELYGLATGFTDLDKLTGGLLPGDMVVIAARPSIGKTTLLVNILDHVAVSLKQPAAIFSLEMATEALTFRALCARAEVNMREIRDGQMSPMDHEKLVQASLTLSNAPLFIDDTPGLSIMQLRARARRLHEKHNLKLIGIDYLTLLNSEVNGRRRRDPKEEVADISAGIKALARELGIPIIVLAQLNREMEKEKNRKPRMSDLRASGNIEQDADTIGLLYKPPKKKGDDDGPYTEAERTSLLIAKQRNGPTGEVELDFFKKWTRFKNVSAIEGDFTY